MSDIKAVVKGAVVGAAIGLLWIGSYKLGKACGRMVGQAVALGNAAKATRDQFDTIVEGAKAEAGPEGWREQAQVSMTSLWYHNSAGIIRDKKWQAVTDALFNRFQEHLDATTKVTPAQE
jgi:hypothetical protein